MASGYHCITIITEEFAVPYNKPRFWLEILILGFMLVFGMATLQAWLPGLWGSAARVFFAAALFGTYALHYERRWNREDRP